MTIYGTSGDDSLDGASGVDIMDGLAGVDTLYGLAGADTLIGGVGDDLYIIDDAGDVVTESAAAGADTVQASVSHSLSANVENLTLTGGSAIDGTGNGDANVITGNSGVNILDGAAGADTLDGAGGDDTLTGGDGADSLTGGAGDDLFIYGDGDDADTITDFTAGSATDDVINLSGVASATVFQDVLDAATDDGTDTTIDFGSGDTITLLGVIESELHSNDFSFA